MVGKIEIEDQKERAPKQKATWRDSLGHAFLAEPVGRHNEYSV